MVVIVFRGSGPSCRVVYFPIESNFYYTKYSTFSGLILVVNVPDEPSAYEVEGDLHITYLHSPSSSKA